MQLRDLSGQDVYTRHVITKSQWPGRVYTSCNYSITVVRTCIHVMQLYYHSGEDVCVQQMHDVCRRRDHFETHLYDVLDVGCKLYLIFHLFTGLSPLQRCLET
jgi:hypothetical protein